MFIFVFVDVMYHINYFAVIEPFLHSWDKSHVITVYYLLMYC